ncbi:MAG: NAD(P)-dependent methylenetetrahydromethanopterin dehydrogenase [Planctomycetia bacterium]
MSKAKILIQLDGDVHASVFDRVVAVDAGVDHLFSYANVSPADVEGLVHGAIFTRGPADLKYTAIFVGGRNVGQAEHLLDAVRKTFFGPMRCSVLMDANGANTTAAAAVLSAASHLDLTSSTALILGGTGPVGRRAALLFARQGAAVRLASRDLARAAEAADSVAARFDAADVTPLSSEDPAAVDAALAESSVVLAAGAAGVRLLTSDRLAKLTALRVLVDLNAVPPTGLEGVEVMDRGREADGVFRYGAIGVGGQKMKIHKAAVAKLFEANDQLLDAEAVYDLGRGLLAKS